MSARASETRAPGGSVTGSTIIPASERFTLSISATWAAIDMLRCTTPRPPSRARAIAMRASVTVSIAAETTGTSSTIVRVSRVAVETAFGRTDDSAGTSRTSSKVSPSFANFAGRVDSDGSSPSFSTSIAEWYRRRRMGVGCLRFDGLQLAERDARLQASGLPRVELPGADLERRGGSRRDRGAQRLLVRPPGVAGRNERRQQHVAGANRRHRFDLRRVGTEANCFALLRAQQGDATFVGRDQDVARPHVRDAVERDPKVLVVMELLADECLRLGLIRGDEEWFGF